LHILGLLLDHRGRRRDNTSFWHFAATAEFARLSGVGRRAGVSDTFCSAKWG